MNDMPQSRSSHDESPTPEESRAKAEATREQLGQTVEALAAKADVKAQVQRKAEDAKVHAQATADQARVQARLAAMDAKVQMREKAADARTQGREKAASARDRAARIARGAREKLPPPVVDKAVRTKDRIGAVATSLAARVEEKTPDAFAERAGRAQRAVGRRRGALLAGAAGALVLVVVRKRRAGKR
ncbi:DUF3618 domain-containing protein [Streptomyces sp. NPDC060184]|uniref:DUF3618 domain-containing protein n=1 Tax=Streptomyces sp. NPDC060184 TaxID=3347064 RepID=UPI00365A144B